MTLIAALACDDGIVIASDSQMSSGATRTWGQKVWAAPEKGFAFALAGHESTIHLLRDALLDATFPTGLAELRAALEAVIKGVFAPEYERAVKLMGGFQAPHMPVGEVIVGAYADGSPHLFHVNWLATVTDCSSDFIAAGTGKMFAEHAAAVFRVHRDRKRSIYQTQLLAFRLIEDAIEIAGPATMIGGEVQMATMEGAKVSIQEWGDPHIKEAVTFWREIEADNFVKHAPPDE